MDPTDAIKRRAREIGFDLVGIAPPAALYDLEFLTSWVKKGFAGEMRYLADLRREDLRRVLPSVKSVICVGLIYNAPYPYSMDVDDSAPGVKATHPRNEAPPETSSRAWISRYAWGTDYHKVMRGKLEELRTVVENLAANVETRVYVDTGPVAERAFARHSSLGWMGKNTCIINEQNGSWFFLGVILTNLALEPEIPALDRCGSCTRCLEACPTGALVEPYVMDASRCISYFTIELRGAIPEAFRTAIGSNVFGCDICQDVCPWNNRLAPVISNPSHEDIARGEREPKGSRERRAAITHLPEFQPLRVEVPSRAPRAQNAAEEEPASRPSTTRKFSLSHPQLEDLTSISEEDFRWLFALSPIKRAKYRGWLRNLCVVMGNSGDRRFIPWLEATTQYSDPVVSEHAAWALNRLRGEHSTEEVRNASPGLPEPL